MNTRPVQGWALPATALEVFEDKGRRFLVLNDGRMLRFDGTQALTVVLDQARPMGLLGEVVLTSDGSSARRDLSAREENVEQAGLIKAIAVEGALVVLDERGAVRHWTPDGERTVVTGVQSLHDANEDGVLVTQDDALVMHALDGRRTIWARPVRGQHGERITAATLIDGGGALVAREGHAMTGEEDVVEIERWG